MQLIFILLLVIILGYLLYFVFKIMQWSFQKTSRILGLLAALFMLALGVIIHTLFFQKMEFIQSEVYNNLYLIKYPVKDQNLIQQQVQQKIKEHLNTKHFVGKKLAYTHDNGIFFYKYSSALPWNIFQDAGTVYFIENEEDLGGFVSEELGMYTEYRIAEFYYNPCENDISKYCGVIDYFNEGAFLKTVHLEHLDYKK